MESLSVLAPAKINLYLNVGARRADGYHDIESVMQTVTLFDRIEVKKHPFSEKNEIRLFCTDPKLPTDENNLIVRAAKAFFEKAKIDRYNVSFQRSFQKHFAISKPIMINTKCRQTVFLSHFSLLYSSL